jgi:hypothetical protein
LIAARGAVGQHRSAGDRVQFGAAWQIGAAASDHDQRDTGGQPLGGEPIVIGIAIQQRQVFIADLRQVRALQAPWQPHTARWLDDAGAAIAQSICAACLLDLEGVILDGSFSRELLAALLAQTELALGRYSWEGVARPALWAGTIGSDARALGGALLPLYANFAPDRDLFLKVGA